MKKMLTLILFCMACLHAQSQFVTIMGETQEVVNDSISADYSTPIDTDDEEDGLQDTCERKNGIKKLFRRISGWLGIKKEEIPLDTVPADPAMLSMDEVENKGMFIFTEADEKRYLDSIKYELIQRRHQVLKRKMMVSMPMDELRVTSYFGYRTDPITHQRKFHNGIDFAAHDNFVNAVLPGLVIYAGYRGGYGYCVELSHGEIRTLYAHLSYILVQKNQPVPAGEPIGISGTTGRSTGEHLHFSVKNKGKYIDPMPILDYLSSILAEEDPEEIEDYMPSYSELRKGGEKRKPDPGQTRGALPTDTIPAETVPSRNTSGMMLVPGDEEVKGKVYSRGTRENSDSQTGIINYSSQGRNEEQSQLVTQGKNASGYKLYPKKTAIPEKKKEKKNVPIPVRNTRSKSGMIVPEGGTIISVKSLTRKKVEEK